MKWRGAKTPCPNFPAGHPPHFSLEMASSLPNRFVIFFDLESDLLFSQCGGSPNKHQKMKIMQISVACALVLDSELCKDPSLADTALQSSIALHYWQDDKDPAFEPLLSLFDGAEAISAYNGFEFDMPLLRKYYGSSQNAHKRYISHLQKFHDPFLRIRFVANYWPKLDHLLLENGLETKSASGVEAVEMWAQGKREELLEYCKEDVRLLAKLCLKDSITVPRIGKVCNHVFGIASCIASLRACEDGKDTECL